MNLNRIGLLFLLTALPLFGQSTNYTFKPTFGVLLTWTANIETDLAGYNVYYGTSTTNYTVKLDRGLGNTTNGTVWCSITNLTKTVDKYFFVVTAYNTSGLESDPSNEVSYDVPRAPTIRVQSVLQAASSVAGPWQDIALYTTNVITPEAWEWLSFYRTHMRIEQLPPEP